MLDPDPHCHCQTTFSSAVARAPGRWGGGDTLEACPLLPPNAHKQKLHFSLFVNHVHVLTKFWKTDFKMCRIFPASICLDDPGQNHRQNQRQNQGQKDMLVMRWGRGSTCGLVIS